MPRRKRSIEPIAPTNIPGERLDPRIPPDEAPAVENDQPGAEEEQQARDSEQAFDRALTRNPPG